MKAAAKYKPNVEIADDSEDLAYRAVEFFVGCARKAVDIRERFSVAISGGKTPRRFYEMLGESASVRLLPWEKIHVFWVDERYVPVVSPKSNYRLAAETFLNKVAVPRVNIHRIPTEYDDIADAVHQYERTIREVFGLRETQVPEFDLIVLGMGVDGHTGSLFRNCYACFDKDDIACAVYSMDDKLNRITLTYPVLHSAAQLAVLVSGQEKASTLRDVLTGEPDEVRYPIHILWPVLDKVTWLADKAAVGEI